MSFATFVLRRSQLIPKGNPKGYKELQAFMSDPHKMTAILHGPAGCGKTTAIIRACYENHFILADSPKNIYKTTDVLWASPRDDIKELLGKVKIVIECRSEFEVPVEIRSYATIIKFVQIRESTRKEILGTDFSQYNLRTATQYMKLGGAFDNPDDITSGEIARRCFSNAIEGSEIDGLSEQKYHYAVDKIVDNLLYFYTGSRLVVAAKIARLLEQSEGSDIEIKRGLLKSFKKFPKNLPQYKLIMD